MAKKVKQIKGLQSMGGKALLKKRGKEYFRQLSKKGAKVRKANQKRIQAIVKQHERLQK